MTTVTDSPRRVVAAERTAAGRQQAVLRLGRRTVRAGGWRNVLIVSLIALGIAVATLVAVAARSTEVPESAYQDERFGTRADVRIETFTGGPAFADLPAELQAFYLDVRGAAPDPAPPLRPVPEVVAEVAGGVPTLGFVERHTAGARLLAIDVSDPLAEGLLLTRGQATPAAGEVLLSAAAMRRHDVGIGDAVELAAVGTVVVVGEVTHPFRTGDPIAVVAPGSLGEPTVWLVDTDDQDDARQLAAAVSDSAGTGMGPERYAEVRRPAGEPAPGSLARQVVTEPSFIGSIVGALILLQVGLVAAAAFATGIRRRIREVGLLGATGASPTQIRQVLLAEALVLGAAGATAGVLVGLGIAVVGQPLIERVTGTVVDGIDVHPLDLVGPATVGVAAALLAAYWPAITASRTATTTALAGRVPLRRIPPWLVPLSVVTTTIGLVVTGLAIRADGSSSLAREAAIATAAVTTALGAASLGVPLLGLGGRLADRFAASPRLVLRDAARQRTRSAATVAAVAVVMMVAALSMTAMATDDARSSALDALTPAAIVRGPHVDGLQLPVTDAAVGRAIARLPVQPTRRLDVAALSSPDAEAGGYVRAVVLDAVGGPSAHAPGESPPALATPEVLDAAGITGDLRRDLLAGDVVVDLADPGTLTADQRDAGRRPAELRIDQRTVVPDLELVSVEPDGGAVPRSLLMSEDLAAQAGLTVAAPYTVLELPRRLTIDEAELAWEQSQTDVLEGYVDVVSVDFTDEPVPVRLLVFGLTLLVVAVITAAATALAATESDRDLATMVAIGADPRTRPRFHGLQAGYHTALGAVIAVPTGLLLHRVAERGGGVVIPWLDLTGLVVGVPLVIAGLMWAAMRPAQPATDRRIG